MEKLYTDRKYQDIPLFNDGTEYDDHTLEEIIARLQEIKENIPDGYLNYATVDCSENTVALETQRLATEEESIAILAERNKIDTAVSEMNQRWEISEYHRIKAKYGLDL